MSEFIFHSYSGDNSAEISAEHDTELTAPTLAASQYENEPLWSEILPGLWQGGTDDDDVVHSRHRTVGVTLSDFDFVTTLYASANPVDWFVQEIRYGIYDSEMQDFDLDELIGVVNMTHAAWKRGKRVLIRCQAGWNRSGLVTALVLLKEGYSPRKAIRMLRERRSPWALCNATFERWIIDEGRRALGITPSSGSRPSRPSSPSSDPLAA